MGWSCRVAFVSKNGQTVFAPKGITYSPETRCGHVGETQVLANSIYCGPLSCDTQMHYGLNLLNQLLLNL